jgi:uncharacterized protein YkwD
MKQILLFVLAIFLFCAGFFSAAASQREIPQRNDSERELFERLNYERSSQGLPELRWDDALFRAARQHALRMLDLDSMEHQLPGEPALAERLAAAGARFSFVAENIAVGGRPHTIHDGWMNSPGHRKNILEPRFTSVGIAAVRGDGELFAVEDFAQSFSNLSLEEQEKRVASLLAAKGLRVAETSADARKACDSNAGPPGVHSWSVFHVETTDLSRLSPEIEKKIRSRAYRNVAVGACRTGEAAGFASYKIALVFY